MEKRNLPWDLIEEIFSRVPAKSLARLHPTSKHCNALFKSKSFAKKHSANAPKEPLIIMLTDSRVFLLKVNFHGFHDRVSPSVEIGSRLDLKDPLSDSSSSQVEVRNIFHCGGLLLFETKYNRLVVCNPCSGETKWINVMNPSTEIDTYALGYDDKSSCKKYKILRMVGRTSFSIPIDEYQIYDFITDSWRVLGDVTTNWELSPYCLGVSMKGNTYWDAFDTSPKGGYFLLSFDFSTERFQSMSLPHKFPYSKGTLSVVGDEKLYLLGTKDTDLDVWVTSNPRSVMSWRNFLTTKNSFPMRKVDFLVDEQNKVVVCGVCGYYGGFRELIIVGEDDFIRENCKDRPPEGGTDCYDLQNYVPSLAQIQQREGT